MRLARNFTFLITIHSFLSPSFHPHSTLDFCIGDGIIGPEATVQRALLEYGIKEDHLMFQSFLYYKNDCVTVNPWDGEVVLQVSSMQASIEIARTLLSQRDDIVSSCGSDMTPVMEQVSKLKNDLHTLVTGMDNAMELARCERVLPLYRRYVVMI